MVEALTMYENLCWLIVANSSEFIIDSFKVVNLTLNSDLVIATPVRSNDSLVVENYTEENETNWDSYRMRQLYKIRKEMNTSLIVHPLGLWNVSHGIQNKSFIPIEKRLNFHKFPLKFGKQNISQATMFRENDFEDDISEQKLMEIVNNFQQFLNTNVVMIYFEKLGRKENEWTDLLGAVVNGEVDLGLHSVARTPQKYEDMTFTHKVLTSIRCIYIKQQPSNELRDIYLIPFGTKLILCVITAAVVLTTFMGITTLVVRKMNNKQTKFGETFSDAAISCIGIFTMQGNFWNPRNCSGNIILITSLALALVVFNSYSAFITSVLSVELANIRSIDDLLESNYNIGYVKNSPDEIYLRSMNDTQLQLIYLKGYLQNTVLNVTEGLLKSGKGNYGFFASATTARSELQKLNNYKCNSDMTEITMANTKNTIAFPLSKNSPYKKAFDLMIMKMYENGIHKYFHSLVVPEYTKCEDKRVFRSAHLSDLTSAFGILLIGIILSILMVVGESLWKKKYKIKNVLAQKKLSL